MLVVIVGALSSLVILILIFPVVGILSNVCFFDLVLRFPLLYFVKILYYIGTRFKTDVVMISLCVAYAYFTVNISNC